MPSGKANRINVSRIVYAVLTEDTKTDYTYGAIKEFGKPMQVQLTPTLAAGVLYGGGAKEEDLAKLTGIDLQVDVNKVPIEVRAEIMGNSFEDGELSENKKDQAKDIAIGFEVEETGDNRELMWLLSGKPKPFANTVQQSTDNITFSTDTINISFKPRQIDGKIRMFGDTANSDFTEEKANTYLNDIPGNTNAITEKAATPVATPAVGEVESGATVTLTCATEGAAIYYTTNGSEPNSGSTLYASPIAITEDVTLKAIAYATGHQPSDVLTAAYTVAVEG